MTGEAGPPGVVVTLGSSRSHQRRLRQHKHFALNNTSRVPPKVLLRHFTSYHQTPPLHYPSHLEKVVTISRNSSSSSYNYNNYTNCSSFVVSSRRPSASDSAVVQCLLACSSIEGRRFRYPSKFFSGQLGSCVLGVYPFVGCAREDAAGGAQDEFGMTGWRVPRT